MILCGTSHLRSDPNKVTYIHLHISKFVQNVLTGMRQRQHVQVMQLYSFGHLYNKEKSQGEEVLKLASGDSAGMGRYSGWRTWVESNNSLCLSDYGLLKSILQTGQVSSDQNTQRSPPDFPLRRRWRGPAFSTWASKQYSKICKHGWFFVFSSSESKMLKNNLYHERR